MEWISVKDRLPDDWQKVVATGHNFGRKTNDRHFVICEFFEDIWMGEKDEEFDYITHWMPLPAPPQEQSHE